MDYVEKVLEKLKEWARKLIETLLGPAAEPEPEPIPILLMIERVVIGSLSLWLLGHVFSVLVLHGPNLNLLGKREPGIYGSVTLAEINRLLAAEGQKLQANVFAVQSNHEGVLVDTIHAASGEHQGILIMLGRILRVWQLRCDRGSQYSHC